MRARHVRILALLLAALAAGGLSLEDAARAQDNEGVAGGDMEVGQTFLISLGGKLYDDVWTVLGETPPAGVNPAFPAKGLSTSRDSWRCVSCHGWDYSGATIDATRIPGLAALKGMDVPEIAAKLRDPAHPFPIDRIPDLAVQVLSLFISQGQYESRNFIDADGKPIGDAESGQSIFEGACINCHQIDGRRYLRGEHGDRSSLGWVVRNRPTQALHKILNGVPGAEMLSLRFLTDAAIADLIAYVGTLDPDEK